MAVKIMSIVVTLSQSLYCRFALMKWDNQTPIKRDRCFLLGYISHNSIKMACIHLRKNRG